MKKNILVSLLFLCVCGVGYGWNGPICYPDKNQDITLTLKRLGGEAPGTLKVDILDGKELELVSIAPSPTFTNAHQVVLRHQAGDQGIVGVHLYTEAGGKNYTYEFEFRSGLCNGAIIDSSLD
jgi:hypothetical protein